MNPFSPEAQRQLAAPQAALWSRASVLALLVLGGCASAPDVQTEVDGATNFAQYQTFAFASPMATERSGQPTIVTQHLQQSARREMRARGLRQTSHSPQLIINLNANVSPPSRTDAPTPPRLLAGSAYYGYRDGSYALPQGYRDATLAGPYPQGTINIEVVDAERKQLVWEGVVRGGVVPKTPDELQAAIDAAVKAAFASYPQPPRDAGM